MHGRADYDDMERTPQRYLRREWKRNKPHLSPSDSLPTLRLCPNRPLFVCGRCGFANTWIPLCLWCAWSSAEATTVFERNMPRPRRLSAPSKIVTPPKTAWRGSPRTVSVESKGRSIEPITPLKDVPVSTHHKALLVQGWVDSTRHSKSRLVDNAIFDRVIKTKMEVMDPEDEVTRATVFHSLDHKETTNDSLFAQSLLPNDDDRHSFSASGTRVRHYRKPLALHLSHARSSSRSDPKIPCGRANDIFTFQGMHSMTSVLSETSNSTHATDDLFAANAAHVDSTVSVQSSHCAPTHTLRRKRPMMLPNRESFGSMHPHSRPSSPSPVCGSKDTSSPSTGTMQSQAPTSPSGSDPLVRLGHPSRPYYSAIRKNMSRPSSPVLPRTPSPILSQFEYVPRGTKSLDGGERPYTSLHYAHHSRPMSMILPGQTYSGFSLSGETEMRINLARWRQEDAPDAPGDYLFQERSRSRIRTKMKHSVRKLGKSLKHLVLGKP